MGALGYQLGLDLGILADSDMKKFASSKILFLVNQYIHTDMVHIDPQKNFYPSNQWSQRGFVSDVKTPHLEDNDGLSY